MGTPQAVDKAVEFLSSEYIEGFRPHAYPDAVRGWDIPTIGYGTTVYSDGSKVKRGDFITLDISKEYLRDYISRSAVRLQFIKSWDIMDDNQKAAVFSFAYNCGTHFYGSKNYRTITDFFDNIPNFTVTESFNVFCLYNNKGILLNRRGREAALFNGLNWNQDNVAIEKMIRHFRA